MFWTNCCMNGLQPPRKIAGNAHATKKGYRWYRFTLCFFVGPELDLVQSVRSIKYVM